MTFHLKKHLLSLTLSLSLSYLFATSPLFETSHTYQEWLSTGATVQTITLARHPNGQKSKALQIQAIFPVHKHQRGTLLFFDTSGRLENSVEGYIEDQSFIPDGIWTNLDQDSRPRLKATYKQGLLNGEMVFFNKKGHIRCRKNYSKGLCNGPYALVNSEGKLIEEGQFEEGLLSGSIWRFDERGEILEEISLRKGLPHGLCITLDHKQHCQIRKYYCNGFLHRIDGPALQVIRQNLSQERSLEYRYGHPFGGWIYYDDQSKPLIIMQWKSPKEAFAYLKDKPKNRWEWKKGILQSCERVDPLKKRKTEWQIKDDLAIYKEFTFDTICLETSLWKKDPISQEWLLQSSHYTDQDGLEVTKALEGTRLTIRNDVDKKIIEKRSTDSQIRLYLASRKNKKQKTLEIQDPLYPKKTLRITFNQKGKRITLESFEKGWQRLPKFSRYTGNREIIEWNQTGSLLFIDYKDIQNKPYESFLFNGANLIEHRAWKEGLEDGSWIIKFDNSQLLERVNYSEGKKEGEQDLWHPNQTKAYVGHYRKGLEEGIHKYFYSNGNLRFSQNYDQGKASGQKEAFDERGNLVLKANYTDEFLNGYFWQKLSEGQTIECFFKDGLLQGNFKAFYPLKDKESNYQVAFIGHYNQSRRDGTFIDYTKEGVVLRELHYKNDLLEGDYFEYHPNKQKALNGHFKEGRKEGTWSSFNMEGTLILSSEFKEGLKEGFERIYNDKGLLVGQEFYVHDKLHGHQKRYDQSGTLIYEASYFEGKLDGWVRKYQQKTKTWIESRYSHGKLLEKK